MSFIIDYQDLLIIQYRNKEKATATVEALATKYEAVSDVIKQFETAFDIDTAVGVQLDILGKIIGLNRNVGIVVPKNAFGFDDNPNSYGFADLNDDTLVTYPFSDLFSQYTVNELNDFDYRFFLKGKIVKNVVKAKMINEIGQSLQDVIDYLFNSKAYVVDNQDMSLDLYIDLSFDTSKLPFIQQLDLLPRPQGVEYKNFISYNTGNTFGFSDNPNSLGFGDLNDTSVGGVFANIIL